MKTQELARQVSTTLGDHIEDFDVEAIVRDLIAAAPGGVLQHIDEIAQDDYWAIVRRHDKTDNG